MKLLLKLSGFGDYEKEIVVEWNDGIEVFPKFAKHDSRFWGSIFYDTDPSGQAEVALWFSEYRETALPVDMFGNPFPVTDLDLMFNLNPGPAKQCECGVDKYGGGGKHSDYCPKRNG